MTIKLPGSPKKRLQLTAQIVISIVVLIILLSAGSQLYFSQERVLEVLNSQLIGNSNKDIHIHFKKAQMSFSGSLSPFFAVKMTDIHLTLSDCKNKVELKSPYILVPLFLSDAFNGRVNMGYIKSGDLDVEVLPPEKKCELSDETEPSLPLGPLKEPYPQIFQKVEEFFQKAQGLRVQSIHARFMKNQKFKEGFFKRVRISFDREESQLFARTDILLPSLTNSDLSKEKKVFSRSSRDRIKMNLEMSRDRGLLISGESWLSQGNLKIESRHQKDLNNFQVKLKINDVPLDFYKNLFNTLTFWEKINSQKVSTHAEGYLIFKHFFEDEKEKIVTMRLKKIDVFGPWVKIYARSILAQMIPHGEVIEPFTWQVETLNVDKIFPHLRSEIFKKVAKDLGVVSGVGITKSLTDIEFEGLLTHFILKSFLREEDKEYKFSKSDLDLKLKKESFSIFLNELPLEDQALESFHRGPCDKFHDSDSLQNKEPQDPKGVSWNLFINQKNYCLH